MGSRLLVLAAAVAWSACAGCDATGRTIGVHNESDCTIKVRFWVGDRGPGHADPAAVRADEVLELRPGQRVRKAINDDAGYRSEAESFVRMQVEPIGASFKRVVHHWLELNPPEPYIVRVFGHRGELRFERVPGTSTLTPVPRELWPRSEREAAAFSEAAPAPADGR